MEPVEPVELMRRTDSLWLIISAAFIFFMLVGCFAREAGLSRSKNSVNVAAKSFGNIGISILIFWLIGFGLMFGVSGYNLGYYGASAFGLDFTSVQAASGNEVNLARSGSFFLFQALICATAFMIVSGAAAERLRFESAALIAIMFAGIIYPVVGHWAWAGQIEGVPWGWLSKNGFVDFGGSAVIHSVAGWFALALLMLLKPRIGRFNDKGSAVNLPKSSLTMVGIGTLLLWLGWFGLIAGQMVHFDGTVDAIFANLLIAGSVGAVAVIPISLLFRSGHIEGELLINGALSGLVAVAGGIHAFGPRQIIIIAIIGAWIMLFIRSILLSSKIDDVTGAVSIHLAAGIWGTIAVGLFGAPALLNTGLSFSNQIMVQMLGVGAIAAWSFLISLLILNALNLIFRLRISERDEVLGLNIAEHKEMPDYSEYPGLGNLLGQ